MKDQKDETYRSLMMCPNCVEAQELFIPIGMPKKDYVISPEVVCKNCGCRLDGKDKPKIPPETAFQGIARRYFHAMWPHDDYLTRDWSSILNPSLINKKRLERLKPVFNATLGLAIDVADGDCHCASQIQALEEPEQ